MNKCLLCLLLMLSAPAVMAGRDNDEPRWREERMQRREELREQREHREDRREYRRARHDDRDERYSLSPEDRRQLRRDVGDAGNDLYPRPRRNRD